MKAGSDPAYAGITLEDLFLCQAGTRPFTSWGERFPVIGQRLTDKRMHFIEWLLKQPPASEKTEDGKFKHLYSNAAYTVAAAMLERVSGKSYERLIHEMLVDDLGLQVVFGWPVDYAAGQPWGHANFYFDKQNNPVSTKNEVHTFSPGHFYRLNECIRPAGDLSMKPLHFAHYTQLHLRGLRKGDNYISSETFHHIDLGYKGFSLGVANGTYSDKSFVGFDGSAGTFYCRSIIFPESNVALTIMINSGSQKAVDWLTWKTMKKYYNWWWKFWL